ncbi:MAG: MBL fold metallo-hydrolase [Bacillota bacterium]
MKDQVVLLGTGDALGVPRVYCDCGVCQEARGGGLNRRTRSSALVRGPAGTFLIDCGPDWRLQMEAVGLRHVEEILITHGHQDHIGGIPDLADSVRWTGLPVRVTGPERALEEVRSRFPWAARGLTWRALAGPLTVGGWAVNAWEVSHGRNGRSWAYRFERPGFAWAYCPDSIDLTPEERAPLHGLDLLILGTAYYDEPAPRSRRSLYSMVEAVALLEEVRPVRAVFTHLSHGVDLKAAYPLPPNVLVARDGMAVELG